MLNHEHPVFARKREDVWSMEKPRGYRQTLHQADWMPASALGHGWYRASPNSFSEAQIRQVGGRGFCVDMPLMLVVGRYLGDGWTRSTADCAEIVLTCGKHDVETHRERLCCWPREGDGCVSPAELTWHERETGKAYQFTASHRGLVDWLREHFGRNAEKSPHRGGRAHAHGDRRRCWPKSPASLSPATARAPDGIRARGRLTSPHSSSCRPGTRGASPRST